MKSNLIPTDVKGDFVHVTDPKIGKCYHISWAYSGACFRLENIIGDFAFLDNPRHRRSTLLKCKKSELRHVRNRKPEAGLKTKRL